MTRIKFIQLYNFFGENQRIEFKKLIQSSYFNKGRDYNTILNGINQINGKNMNSKEFVRMLSKNLSLRTRTVWNRLSELMKLAELFIAVNELKKNKILYRKTISSYYVNNNIYNLYEQKYKSTIKEFERLPMGLESFYNYFENLQIRGFYHIHNNEREEYFDNLTKQIIYLSTSYATSHYLHLTELIHQKKYSSYDVVKKDLSFLNDKNTERFIEKLKHENEELFLIVSFHYNIFKAFLEIDESYYKRARKVFKDVYKKLSNDYKAICYQMLINYCIERTNAQDKKYYAELFDLYNEKLEQGLIQDLRVGNIPINNFRDYIFVALVLGKIQWIEEFIKKYSPELPEKVRDEEINLSYGLIYYHRKDFEKSIEYLNKVKGGNYIHYIDSKFYKLRVFYDTGQYEDALMEIDSSNHYLRKHKEIPESFQKSYRDFITNYNKLLKITFNKDKYGAEYLIKELSNQKQTSRKQWIIEKLKVI